MAPKAKAKKQVADKPPKTGKAGKCKKSGRHHQGSRGSRQGEWDRSWKQDFNIKVGDDFLIGFHA